MESKRSTPEIVLRDGKPVAVLLDIEVYLEMLERLEEMDELKALEEMRQKPLDIASLEALRKKNSPNE